MGGVDTIRGIAFQHAYAIQLALDVIDDPDVATLTIEGSADVVDVQLARKSPPPLQIFQIKSRQEPYDWPPADIAKVISKWQDAGGGAGAPLRFVSDGPASRETGTKLMPALERAREGKLRDDDRNYLHGLGIKSDTAANVQLATRTDSTGALLAMGENRLRRLLALASPVVDDAAERAVDRLFRQFAVEGGQQRIERRTFNREELAQALGIDLALVDAGSAWSASIADEYRAAITASQAPHGLAELAALLDPTAVTPALSLMVSADADDGGVGTRKPASNLVDQPRGGGVSGAAGTGKTTSAQQMAMRAAGAGRTAVVVSAYGYRRGDLHRRVRRVLEDGVGRPLAPSAVEAALGEEEATMIVDSLTGLSSEQEDALAADLRDARERFPELRLIVTARERAFARRLELPTYALAPLASGDRTTIATGLVADPSGVVADLERNLGDVVDNPLLFVMALALTRVGVAVTSRAAIFAGFTDGLCERAKETTVDAADLAALRLAAVALTGEGRFSADRYWWLTTLAGALSHLSAGGVYDVGNRNAEAVFKRLQAVGLLFEDDLVASVSLLHDAFRDYFASVALARGEAELPRPVGTDWEQVVELLAEQDGLTAVHARALAVDSVVAATRAARFDRGAADAALTGEIARILASTHLGESPCGVDFGVVIARGADHVYALVASDSVDADSTLEETQWLAEESPFVVALASDAGSLTVACALWREFLRRLISAEPPALRSPVPTSPVELAEAVAEQFRAQREELEALAARLVPTLTERLLAGVGWSGLRACVDEAQTTTLPGQQWTYHPLRYRFGGEDVIVARAPHCVDGAEFDAHATAEGFVERPPHDVALDALGSALRSLLPETT